MFRAIVLFFVAIATCYGESPASSTTPVKCGIIPQRILGCLGNPMLITQSPNKCSIPENECTKMTCVFQEMGWMDGDKVNKKKVSDHLDKFSSDYPVWLPAVTYVKATCLGDAELPAQGYYLGCPPYDIMHCFFTGLLKKAAPSQWKTTPECQQYQRFVASCPICPTDCFAPLVPIGSCNACASLPRSP